MTDPKPPAVTLAPMTSAEYDAWLEGAIRDYALDNVQAGNWSEAEAQARSADAFHKLLPQGPATPGQHLFSIWAAPEPGAPPRVVGMIWFAALELPSQAFIYDFMIDPACRRRGYGEQALRAVEAEVRALGLTSLKLHVFAFNHAACALYEKVGYEVTNLHMTKRLPPEG